MLELDFNNVFTHKVGKKFGIDEQKFYEYQKQFENEFLSFVEDVRNKKVGFFRYIQEHEDINNIIDIVDKVRKRFENLVVIGIGGSINGTTAFAEIFADYLDKRKSLFFIDNLSDELVQNILSKINVKKTAFNFVSKSGNTVEIVTIFLILKHILERKLGKNYKEHLIITTGRNNGYLRRISEEMFLTCLDVPEDVGGRFSAITAVGLFPLSFAGFNVKKFLLELEKQTMRIVNLPVQHNPILILSTLFYIFTKVRRKEMFVFMPYSSRFRYFVEWFKQLWDESLGKKSAKNDPTYKAVTLLPAIGPMDQHSQLQLFLEGPKNKLVVFLTAKMKNGLAIEGTDKDWLYLTHKNISEIVDAEKIGTEISMTKNNIPNITITIGKLDVQSISQLIVVLISNIILYARFFGVSPFDQPAVEESKVISRAILNPMGERKTKLVVDNFFSDLKDEFHLYLK